MSIRVGTASWTDPTLTRDSDWYPRKTMSAEERLRYYADNFDLVEVDAGDTYVYDDAGRAAAEERERRAADRLFGLLPDDQGSALRALCDEFETGTSPEARFARALDRFAGFLLNHASEGASWRENGVTADRVHARNEPIGSGSAALWDEVQRRLADAGADARPAQQFRGGDEFVHALLGQKPRRQQHHRRALGLGPRPEARKIDARALDLHGPRRADQAELEEQGAIIRVLEHRAASAVAEAQAIERRDQRAQPSRAEARPQEKRAEPGDAENRGGDMSAARPRAHPATRCRARAASSAC